MTDNKILNYETPQVELIEVQVEQGFATSAYPANPADFGWGGDLSGNQ